MRSYFLRESDTTPAHESSASSSTINRIKSRFYEASYLKNPKYVKMKMCEQDHPSVYQVYVEPYVVLEEQAGFNYR